MPDAASVRADLNFVPELQTSADCVWRGMVMRHCTNDPLEMSVGNWSRTLALNWHIPLTAACLYLVGIVALKKYVQIRGKFDVKGFAFYWNVLLSAFSWAGVFACAPVLLKALHENGLYFATCAPAEWYGMGLSGTFILLFVLSKLAELVDTVLLVLSGKPVILLHWWHHTTVMLYCWHSYSSRISTGIWFAAMNYFVHSIMYAYFAATQTPIRKHIFPYAMYITLLQIVQMLVGIWITVKAVLYQIDGQECHVNKTNSVLGLLMYLSYFLLFAKLFIDHYLLGRKTSACKPAAGVERDAPIKKEKSIIRSVSSRVLQSLDSDDDSADDVDGKSIDNCSESPVRNRKIVRDIASKHKLVDSDGSGSDQADEKIKKKDQ